jgi:hypothetical protein
VINWRSYLEGVRDALCAFDKPTAFDILELAMRFNESSDRADIYQAWRSMFPHWRPTRDMERQSFQRWGVE